MKKHDIPGSVQPIGVARYLSRAWPRMPGWVIRGAIKEKNVRVNGARAGANAIVKGGDELILYIEDKFFGAALSVIFADDRLLVIEKPAGLPVDADGGDIGEDTLLNRARMEYPAARLCHRLDTGTGGALICALDEEMHRSLLDAFAQGAVKKSYHAVLSGCPSPRKKMLSHYLVKDAAQSRVRVTGAPLPGAKSASLTYSVLDAEYGGHAELSLSQIILHTGRTHQIRAQLAHIGHPVLGDDKYGDRKVNRLFCATHPMLWCVDLQIMSDAPALAAYKGKSFYSPDQFRINARRSEA